jgi:hypothetical protein
MKTPASNSQESKQLATANDLSKKQDPREPAVQLADMRPESIAQRKLQEIANQSPQVNKAVQLQAMADKHVLQQKPVQKKNNDTGLPDQLKAGIENLSGYSMDSVKVHYNSNKPAQLQAHAYAQGNDIHLASGQEKHLAHEAWHVVQQKQGRVQATMQMKGNIAVNDDAGLEHEADVMGAKALQMKLNTENGQSNTVSLTAQNAAPVVQRYRTTGKFTASRQASAPLFTEQAIRPALLAKTSWRSLWQTVNHSLTYPVKEKDASKTTLLVADDGSMAINKTSAEAKEFYALPSVLETSNSKLENVHSTVRLVGHNNTLTVGGKALGMITAGQVRVPEDDFDDLLNYECYKVAAEVIGMKGETRSELVLGNAKHEQTVNINPGPLSDSSVTKLTRSLANSDRNTSIDDAVNEAEHGEELGKESNKKNNEHYGRRLNKGNLSQQAYKLKVNEFAKADVGEAYATYTNAADGEGLKDFSEMVTKKKPTVREKTWGYHYAGVAAKSLDGKDSVTLENYNRRDDIIAKGPEIKEALLAKFRTRLGNNYNQINQTDASQLFNTFSDSEGVVKEFMDEYKKILNSAEPNKAWYFAMYGSLKDQSFHEKQAASGFFSNPLTIRVRKLMSEAKQDWNAEITQHVQDLQNYVTDHDNETSKKITGGNIVQALQAMDNQINQATSSQELLGVGLALDPGVLDLVLEAADTDSKQLTLQSIGAERSLLEIATDLSPKFDLVEEQLKLQKIEKLMARLKRMI